jgi:hypothetical protein
MPPQTREYVPRWRGIVELGRGPMGSSGRLSSTREEFPAGEDDGPFIR